MEAKPINVKVSENLGQVSGLEIIPSDAVCVLTLAHGAGAGMHHIFMHDLALALAASAIGTVRFNFPFTEAGKKRPDPAPVAEKTIMAVLSNTHERHGNLPLIASGKSFGGRMTSQLLSKNGDIGVKGVVFYGFPLHASGDPGISRAEHLKTVQVPMLFLQGTRDALAELGLITGVAENLKLAELKTFEGADHSFKAGKKTFVVDLALATRSWVDRVLVL